MALEIFLSHSLDKALAGKIALATAKELADAADSFNIRVDALSLVGGDPWRKEIFQWLEGCAGAIILIDRKALTSKWVLFEATILCWRYLVFGSPNILPIVIGEGGNFPTEEEWKPFAPFEFRAWQQEKVKIDKPAGALEPADEAALVSDIAGRIAGFLRGKAFATRTDSMSRWAEKFENLLLSMSPNTLSRAAEELSAPQKTGQIRKEDLPQVVARLILNASPENSIATLDVLTPGLIQGDGKTIDLIENMRQAWIPYEVAIQTLAICTHEVPESRSLAIFLEPLDLNIDLMEEAKYFIERAFFKSTRIVPIRVNPKMGAGGSEEFMQSLIQEIRSMLNDKKFKRRGSRLAEGTSNSQPVIMIPHNPENQMDGGDWEDLQEKMEILAKEFPVFPRVAVVSALYPGKDSKLPSNITPITYGVPPDLEVDLRTDWDDISNSYKSK